MIPNVNSGLPASPNIPMQHSTKTPQKIPQIPGDEIYRLINTNGLRRRIREILNSGKALQKRVFEILKSGNDLLERIPRFNNSKYYKEMVRKMSSCNSRANYLLNHPHIAQNLTSQNRKAFIRGKITIFQIKHPKMHGLMSRLLKSLHI